MRSPFQLFGCAVLAVALAGCSERALEPVGDGLSLRSASASVPPFVFPSGCCFYQNTMVRTVVPPAAAPQEGRDNFYGFPSGAAEGQKGVVGVAPGDTDYHGGQWKFHAVTWNVTPYLLTSEDGIAAAAASGDVVVTRVPGNDFKCPIQP
ncbi:MAG TPA: hypothetical protein VF970_00255 [Gemmatimonadales bacterium]